MLKIENLTKTYNYKKSNAFTALKDVSLEVEDGEMLAIIGKSGAGKSTLLHIIGCIDKFEKGSYIIDGTDVHSLSDNKLAKIRNEKVGIVMQDFALIDEYSVIENVMIPLNFSKKKLGKPKELAMKALERVGLANLAKKPVSKLSGGLSETIKHACLGDLEMFEYLEKNIEKVLQNNVEACEFIAERNCRVKYNVVMKDERESGLREILNLGHTVGRAIETVSDYKLLHGEALSIGMVAQVKLGNELGFISEENMNRVIDLYKRANLPITIPDYIDKNVLVKKLYTDKKVRDGKLRFVFQKEIGDVMCFGDNAYGLEIAENQIAKIIENM